MEAQMPFIRNLASSDRKLRTTSLDSLKLFLSSRTCLTQTDALKLWKGLYYAMWMTDRPIPQQRLAADLGRLADDAPIRSPADKATWFSAFWDVLGQQWSSIDKHRLDKFLMLVRRVLAANLRLASQEEDVAAVLTSWPLDKEGDLRAVPLGLRLHVLDILVDELEREACLENDEFVQKIGQVLQSLYGCPIKQVRERSRETYSDERLPWAEKKADEDRQDVDGDDDDDEWGGFDD
ncbi:ribosomal RNA-processing protein 1 [Geosmithia morbida]|uniref:Ribosomal RNA-processing protein 1 n=1 Tax=Geosmithia morbida TaxID=1094350 RepID=A0A9P5D385_9HYPO|nr:ribosomal RNA-processing protein 1 [Geosmithia morbida]KAF4122281.1 ribosomal RNA-processing protein 1 [Geosmithia morbida]